MTICAARSLPIIFDAEACELSILYDETQAWLREGLAQRCNYTRQELHAEVKVMFRTMLRDCGVAA